MNWRLISTSCVTIALSRHSSALARQRSARVGMQPPIPVANYLPRENVPTPATYVRLVARFGLVGLVSAFGSSALPLASASLARRRALSRAVLAWSATLEALYSAIAAEASNSLDRCLLALSAANAAFLS
jgi:hypothetical protein